jgi:aspartyl-tRNA(Asn)/glutamyl-tRNA(Gln) amidotransferase subunit B
MGPSAKSTRGWDDSAGQTYMQREKEDAHDYRYFPDPDLLPVAVDNEWREAVRARIPELPHSRFKRYIQDYALSHKEAAALTGERDICLFYEACVAEAGTLGVVGGRAGKQAANYLLQSGAKRANELAASGTNVLLSELGISAAQVAGIVKLREDGAIGSNQADELFGLLCEPAHRSADAASLASARGMLIIRDEGALERWCDQAIADNAKAAEDVRAGKLAAIGRLVGAAMKLSGGQGDAASVRKKLLEKLGQAPA